MLARTNEAPEKNRQSKVNADQAETKVSDLLNQERLANEECSNLETQRGPGQRPGS